GQASASAPTARPAALSAGDCWVRSNRSASPSDLTDALRAPYGMTTIGERGLAALSRRRRDACVVETAALRGRDRQRLSQTRRAGEGFFHGAQHGGQIGAEIGAQLLPLMVAGADVEGLAGAFGVAPEQGAGRHFGHPRAPEAPAEELVDQGEHRLRI